MKSIKSITRQQVFRRFASNSIAKPPVSTSVPAGKSAGKKTSSGGSPFDSSFSFQLFLIVGAMGAGYTLGKTSITTDPPATLFPKGSITPFDDLKEFKDDLNYDRFKRCILRILESKGVEVDVKHGKNEKLYEEVFCNEEIAKLMNDIDGLGDVFFGKDEQIWSGKHFRWFPQSTEDVSMILKLANEFSVPVYTKSYGRDTSGLGFELDFSKFTQEDCSIGGTQIDPRIAPIDLFLLGCGVKPAGKYINGVPVDSIKEITAVLADGTVLETNKGEEAFTLLTGFSDELCVITNVKAVQPPLESSSSKLVIIGTNSTDKLNETINDVSKRLPNIKIAVVDSHNPQTKLYGDYPTFAIFKASATELKSLNKKYGSGEEGSNYKIMTLPLEHMEKPLVGDITADGILATDDVINTAFQALKNPDENVPGDELTIQQSVLRRLKLSMDSKLILNRDLTIRVE